MVKRWYFTLVLLLGYVVVFQSWRWLDRPCILGTGLFAAGLLGAGLIWAARQSYFANRWDMLFHAVVIFDILIEGWLIRIHDHYGFYLCALAFAAVLTAYRAVALGGSRGCR